MKPATVMLVFLLIHLHFLAAQVSSIDTLWRGDSLNSYSQLISTTRIFTLGFHTPQGTNNTYLAVWYTDGAPPNLAVWYTDRAPPNPPVWIANRENPFPPSSNLSLTIDASGSLVIIGRRPGVESFEIYSGGPRNNLSATLLDTGNFVVREANSSGEILWQSFDYPTDTLLPGMKIGFNQRTGRNWTLSSWFDESNPAHGAFTLEWDSNVGRLVIRRRGVIYWTSGRMRDYYEDTGNFRIKEFDNMHPAGVFNFNYNFSSVTNGEDEYFIYTPIYIPFTERKIISGWRMDYNGDLSDIGQGYLVMSSRCYGYESKRPGVQTGCQVWEQPTCRNQRQTFTRRAGIFSGGASTSFYDRNASLGPSDCRENCWDDCECMAYFPSSDGCRFWRGRMGFVQSPDGITDADLMYLLETAPSGMKTYVKIILVVLSAMVVFFSGVAFFLMRKLKQVRREKELHELLTLEGYTDANEGGKSHDLRLFTYASVQSATRNFSSDHKLGQGGFGPVYKGITSEGKDIAVKLLSRQSGQGLLEFKTELILISKLQHVNLVKLIGFSIHGNDKMIIYEYMHNKSLDFFLFSPSQKQHLDWQRRFNIIEGIAEGLLYLHKYSRLKIIHRDLKPSNILLDENMNPKISDFGLARIIKQDISEVNTNRHAGTYGYMAPEYAMQGIFSFKSDVYSFGVLVLEIVSGRKNNIFQQTEGPLSLVEHAWELWRKDCALDFMDPTLGNSCIVGQVQKCIHVGLLCVENLAVDRPSIEDVTLMLKNEMTNLPMPKNPGYITKNNVNEDVETSLLEKLSVNELTLTEIGGR